MKGRRFIGPNEFLKCVRFLKETLTVGEGIV